jgi:hypothetical protein
MTDRNAPTPPPLDDCNLLTFFVEPGTPHPMMSSGAGLWLAADPGNPKLLADYMRRCAGAIEEGAWTAGPVGAPVIGAVEIVAPRVTP